MVCIVSNQGEVWEFFKKEEEAKPTYISNLGRVLCATSGIVKQGHDNGNGYSFFLQGNTDGKAIREYIHRAVAKCFLPNPDDLPQVNHKSLDKSDNSVENLEWVSRSANIRHAHESGAMRKRTENGHINVLSDEQVVELCTRVVSFWGRHFICCY